MELINRIKEKKQLSVIFITHDLGVVANMADRIAVMYAGKIVEHGTALLSIKFLLFHASCLPLSFILAILSVIPFGRSTFGASGWSSQVDQ